MVDKHPEELPIVGGQSFELTEADVAATIATYRKAIADADKELASEPAGSKMYTAAERWKASGEHYLGVLTAADPAEIIEGARYLFERAAELGESGADEAQIALMLEAEVDGSIADYNEFLAHSTWGYRLGQELMSAQARLRSAENA